MKYLLDTHVWIWWNMAPEKLSEEVISIIGSAGPETELMLSAISPWEFCKLLEKDRLAISCDTEEWLSTALSISNLRIVPLSPHISYLSTVLPKPFHDDPADQIIAATAREENATLLTKDRLLIDYPHVRTRW